jgi:hypothetical protein
MDADAHKLETRHPTRTPLLKMGSSQQYAKPWIALVITVCLIVTHRDWSHRLDAASTAVRRMHLGRRLMVHKDVIRDAL